MPEVTIPLSELYALCPGKPKGTCPVRFCRKCSRKAGRLCHMHDVRAWRKRNPTRAAYNTLRDHAKGRGLEFSITFEDFQQICEATGYSLKKGISPNALSMDRRDFRKGYVPGNIRVTTVSINSAKGTHEKFIKLSNGLVEWCEIEIEKYIEKEQERADRYDPRNTHKSIPASFDDDDEERLEKTFGLCREPELAACPF